MTLKIFLQTHVQKVIHDIYPSVSTEVSLEYPRDRTHGDFSCNIALQLSKELGKPPREIAQKIVEHFPKEDFLKDITIAGPGFINFLLQDSVLYKALHEKEEKNTSPRTILVEYGQENIAKPTSVGHLRSNIIGQSLFNIFSFLGENVISDNHLGDWGTQFGKVIVAYKKWGNDEKIQKNPLEELVQLYVRFHTEAKKDPPLEDAARKEFKKLEDGDIENKKLWEWFRSESLKGLEKIHKRLGTTFDYMHGEAFFEKDLPSIISELLEKGIAQTDTDGSIIVSFPEEFSSTPLLIQKSDGATLYATRDLATVKFYISEFKPDLVLQCAGAEQSLHFRQFYDTAIRAGWITEGQFVHIKNGMIALPEGKMSTRKGRVILLESLLDEAEQRIETILEEKKCEITGEERKNLISTLGIGAVIFADLGQTLESNITFTWEKALNFEGYSGPYIQYTYARSQSILRKNEESIAPLSLEKISFSDPSERALAFLLTQFHETVLQAAKSYHPHIIAQYIFDLAQKFNAFYHAVPVLKSANPEKSIRLFLTQKTGEILKQGLGLLNIQAPERM